MQLSKIIHLKFLLEFLFEPLQFSFIASQYDQIVHIESYHQQRLTRLSDVH